ncbi:MAG: redoxin domain-containing protein [candidate division Zixibacteria bacterium]|nr:redoxin domain-containing protein [candidate division Zixibacteria bacterium]
MKIGDKLPEMEFEIFHENEIKKVNLGDYKGKWLVMLFYPADFTFVCPTELEEAAEHYELFKKSDAEIISVSTDTAFVHKAWHDVSPAIKKVDYPMLADPAGKLCRLFGTYIEDEGLSLRATFIFDPDGILKSLEIHDNSIGRSAREILRKFQAAKFVRENPDSVCPASWEPGREVLKPKFDLIGNI